MAWSLTSLETSLLVGSTLVEGSTLTEREAKIVLRGRTVQGHPISEIRELLNYRAAVGWLIRELAEVPFVSADLILGFHERLFRGFPGERGQWKTHRNFTFLSDGSRHDYLAPSEVPRSMREWLKRFNADPVRNPGAHAARLYHGFQEIHPFEDGNGRIGRILLAYWIHWKAGREFTFRLKDKIEHLDALEAAGRGNLKRLARFLWARTRKERR